MKPVIFKYGTKDVRASVDLTTMEVMFSDPPVIGKMWLISPPEQFVEIFEREGKYYLEPAA